MINFTARLVVVRSPQTLPFLNRLQKTVLLMALESSGQLAGQRGPPTLAPSTEQPGQIRDGASGTGSTIAAKASKLVGRQPIQKPDSKQRPQPYPPRHVTAQPEKFDSEIGSRAVPLELCRFRTALRQCY